MYPMCTYTGRLSNESLKGVVRIWGLYTVLIKDEKFVEKCKTKEKGFVLRGVVNCGKVNKWRKLLEDKGYFSMICLCRPIAGPTFCLQ